MTQNMKRRYEKPTVKVYELQHRHQILAGSPTLPLSGDDEPTDDQW